MKWFRLHKKQRFRVVAFCVVRKILFTHRCDTDFKDLGRIAKRYVLLFRVYVFSVPELKEN